MADAPRLILASASAARRAMLEASGLTFEIIPADVDEAHIRAAMTAENDCVEAADVAAVLAAEKALAVARAHPGALAIGSDQVLALGSRLFSKAETLADARDVLDRLRGRTHELVSAAALARDDVVVWRTIDSAQLTMRRFSDEFLGHYLSRMGSRALTTVGGYELEGLGVQMFDAIEGDYFTILGMPLLPLLAELRRQGLVLS
ncbi:MAG: Maf family protein [Hyphomicrobium sp.]